MTTSSRAGRVIGSSLLNLAALGGLACIVLVILAFFFNITLIMFKTGSMSPTIPAGSLAVVREIPASDIKLGDVLTVDRAGMLPVTHRVTSVSGEGEARTITMKGDANDAEDPSPYTLTQARRVLFSVPELAKVVVWFSNPLVLGGITIAASALVTWAFWPRGEQDGGEGRRRKRGRHRSAVGGEVRSDSARISAAAVTAVLLGGALAVVPQSPASAVGGAFLGVESTSVARGTYLTLTSIGDAEAMSNMQPNVPVLWQIGVSADAPEPGTVSLSLEASGDSSLGLSLEIRSCSVQWVGGVCDGAERSIQPRLEAPLNSGLQLLESMPASEQRWMLVSAMVPPGGEGEVSLAVRAQGDSDSIAVGPGTVGTIARTGAASAPPMLLLGGVGVSAGLLVAGAAAVLKRRGVPA